MTTQAQHQRHDFDLPEPLPSGLVELHEIRRRVRQAIEAMGRQIRSYEGCELAATRFRTEGDRQHWLRSALAAKTHATDSLRRVLDAIAREEAMGRARREASAGNAIERWALAAVERGTFAPSDRPLLTFARDFTRDAALREGVSKLLGDA